VSAWDWIGAGIFLAVGIAAGFVNNYLVTKHGEVIGNSYLGRQLISIVVLIAALLTGMWSVTPWSAMPALVGAAVGLIIPGVVLAVQTSKHHGEDDK